MAFRDVRQFIEALKKTGEVVCVKQEVDWDLEAAAIARRACERRGPAILFENIKDYPQGYRMLLGSLATFRRCAIAMGLHPDISIKDILAEYERREAHPIKPVIVKDGPCKENVILGEDVDLCRFPAPMIHEGDGGRYLASWDIVVSKDPDSDWVNWGVYRFMIHDQKHLVGFPSSPSHLGMVLMGKYAPRNQAMPIAIVMGADPISHFMATAAYRVGESEVDFAGAMRQEPVELIKCETSDLLVPANAEIVIEGEALPNFTAPEGPFGEFPGYRSPEVRMGVVCQVKAITHRDDPILTSVSLGMPIDENHITQTVSFSLQAKRRLKEHGIPVVDVYAPPEWAVEGLVVSVKSGGKEVVKRIGDIIGGRRSYISKIIVVDEDVDVFNLDEVLHALMVKCHPRRGIMLKEGGGKGNPVMPYFNREERLRLELVLGLFDCTWPPEWSKETDRPIKASFNDIYPKEVREKILMNWTSYGFK